RGPHGGPHEGRPRRAGTGRTGTGGPGGPAARGTPDLNGESNGAPREDASHSGRYPRLHDVRLLRPRLAGVSGGGLGGRFASRSPLRHAPVRNARTAGPAAASSGEARRGFRAEHVGVHRLRRLRGNLPRGHSVRRLVGRGQGVDGRVGVGAEGVRDVSTQRPRGTVPRSTTVGWLWVQ